MIYLLIKIKSIFRLLANYVYTSCKYYYFFISGVHNKKKPKREGV